MATFAVATACGRALGVAADEATFRAAVETVLEPASAGRKLAGPLPLAFGDAWIKGDHLPGRARWRHSLARAFGGRVPALREHASLIWLRTRLFRAPEPLAAGAIVRGGLVRYQFLATARIDGATPLETALGEAKAAQREAWIDELAGEVARLHSLHVVHRDLHLRNVLARAGPPPASGDPRALTFVDVRRSGAAMPGRDAAYDLACLFLEGASLLAVSEQRRFLARYLAERRALGHAAEPSRLLEAVDRRRRALVRGLDRDPARWRLREPVDRTWTARSLSP